MFHTIRIKNKGFYLGRDCPAEGIVVSDFIITVLKSMGADVEIYDPEEEARIKKAKLEEEQAKKQEEAKEVLTAPVDEKVQEVETENQEVVEDSQESVEEIQEKETEVQEAVENPQEEIKEVQEAKEDKFYTDDELSLLTVAELKAILTNRGHTDSRKDLLAPRYNERRASLIEKVKSTQ